MNREREWTRASESALERDLFSRFMKEREEDWESDRHMFLAHCQGTTPNLHFLIWQIQNSPRRGLKNYLWQLSWSKQHFLKRNKKKHKLYNCRCTVTRTAQIMFDLSFSTNSHSLHVIYLHAHLLRVLKNTVLLHKTMLKYSIFHRWKSHKQVYNLSCSSVVTMQYKVSAHSHVLHINNTHFAICKPK